jgi:hypothetical protein
LVRNVPSDEKLYIEGDLNGHVGSCSAGFERVHGALAMALGIKGKMS